MGGNAYESYCEQYEHLEHSPSAWSPVERTVLTEKMNALDHEYINYSRRPIQTRSVEQYDALIEQMDALGNWYKHYRGA